VRGWNVEERGHQGLRRGWGRRRLVGIAVHRDRGSERSRAVEWSEMVPRGNAAMECRVRLGTRVSLAESK
jgi:hypothetical protein